MAKVIQLGIDLGTTNSAIVVSHNGKYEVIKNSDQLEYTPSVFGYNKGGNPQVGKKAYDQLFQLADKGNVGNYKAEVKRLMGTAEKVHFERTNEDLSAEEISSEILKYLKDSVVRKYPDINTDGVVITVPAYFTTTQKEATKRAGELAGFKYVILMQEPIAGAIAYGYDNEVNENRLVYDLGGGTFDVAIISSKDGTLTVKGHAGDNYLGGKDFDNLIINKIILPELEKKYSFDDIMDDKEKKHILLNKLKYFAEDAKKQLTDSTSTTIVIDNIEDDEGDNVYEEIEFTRERFEELIDSKVTDSINLCKKAIDESGLSINKINRIILVGGSTQSPYIRQKLEQELGIQVDSSVDPLTVVAKGACVFGGSQIIPEDLGGSDTSPKKASNSNVTIKLNYEPVVSDTDTTVTGIVSGIDTDKDYYIQIQSEDGKYTSNKIKLKNGKFFDTVLVSKGQVNTYFVYLSDGDGNIIETNIDSFSITHGLSIAGVPLSYSISVALHKKTLLSSKNEDYCDVIFEKGAILPLKKKVTYHTVKSLTKGESGHVLPIRFYEGESKKPESNYLLCELKLTGQDIPYALPEGTEVELEMEMDESGTFSVIAYFPDIDYQIKDQSKIRTEHDENISNDRLKKDLAVEKKRISEMESLLSDEEKENINNMYSELAEDVNDDDDDTRRKTDAGIKKLREKLDKNEMDTESTKLINEYDKAIEHVNAILKEFGGEDVVGDEFESLKKEGKQAISDKNRESLESIIDSIDALHFKIIFNTSKGLKGLLSSLYQDRNQSKDPVEANRIFERAVRYMDADDISGMQQCVREIFDLMPRNVQQELGGDMSSGIGK